MQHAGKDIGNCRHRQAAISGAQFPAVLGTLGLMQSVDETGKAEWVTRLLDLIERRKTSPRAVSIAAGLNPTFVYDITNREMPRKPNIEALKRIATALESSVSYIIDGVELSQAQLSLLETYMRLPEHKRALARELIESLADHDAGRDEMPAAKADKAELKPTG